MKKPKFVIRCEYLISMMKQRSCEVGQFSPHPLDKTLKK